MTKEELKQEAEELYEDWYAHKLGAISIIDVICKMAEPREKQIEIDAEQIRALQKQNGELTDKIKELEVGRLQWHDLRKDPNDLPQKYIPVLNQYGEHRSYDGHYWRDCDDVIYTDTIAWCEVPQFEEIKEK